MQGFDVQLYVLLINSLAFLFLTVFYHSKVITLTRPILLVLSMLSFIGTTSFIVKLNAGNYITDVYPPWTNYWWGIVLALQILMTFVGIGYLFAVAYIEIYIEHYAGKNIDKYLYIAGGVITFIITVVFLLMSFLLCNPGTC